MKAISLHQPWATAIALGSKRVETRSRPINYRGTLAIHAAKRFEKSEFLDFTCQWHWCGALHKAGWRMDHQNDPLAKVPFGAIVAICEVVACRPTGFFTQQELDTPRWPAWQTSGLYKWTERQMGDFRLGRWGWVLKDIQPLLTPLPWKGSQGFFEVPDGEILRCGLGGVV